MRTDQLSSRPQGGRLKTLAQTATILFGEPTVLRGEGSSIKEQKVRAGRARRKLITQCTMINLVKAVGTKDKARIQSYWNSFHCQTIVHSLNGKLYGKYCKNRHCTLCCSIRKATIINKYLPVMEEWPGPYHVVLTRVSVKREELAEVIDEMLKIFVRIIGSDPAVQKMAALNSLA